MKYRGLLRVGLALLWGVLPLGVVSVRVAADATPPALAVPAGLSIAELKMTGDKFLVLQNNTPADISDLSSYWLYDFNSVSPLSPGVNSSQQQLPAVTLAAGETLLLSAAPQNTCGAAVAGKLSVNLGDSGGFLEIIQLSQATPNGPVTQTAGDSVSWSSTATAGAITSVPSSSKDPAALYYRYQSGTDYTWQLADIDASDACQFDVAAPSSSPIVTGGLLAPTGNPPATIVSVASTGTAATGPTLPAADIGLSAPQITELLPNPSGTGTDGSDEFIELYNSNAKNFDLSGFILQTGLTTKHSYTFPQGTTLPPKGFVAFYSADTSLSLSNTSGQADLADPFGTVIAQAGTYGMAKDSMAWTLANGTWYWTTKPTPGAANIVNQTPGTSIKTTSAKKAVAAVKGAATTKSPLQGSGSTSSSTDTAAATPIHPVVLAAVAVLAVGYVVYEYRHDLANRLHQFRTNRAVRRANRG